MITIGLMGGIAAGKSEVARLLAARGARIVDADRVAHETYALGQAGHVALVAAFGDGVLDAAGAIDRRKLGAIVFDDRERLELLNAIVWPLTRRRIEGLKQQAAAEGIDVFVIEAPLLIEAGWRDLVDVVWYVRAAEEVALARLLARGHAEAEARSRLGARPALDQAAAAADAIIDNSGSLQALRERVDELWRMLQGEA